MCRERSRHAGGTAGSAEGTASTRIEHVTVTCRSLRRSSLRIAVITAGAGLVVSCSSNTPGPTPAPSQTPDPASASLAAYADFWRVSQQAFNAPASRDWSADLGRVARGQALTDLSLEIQNYAAVPAHVEGALSQNPVVDPTVPPTSDRVAILDCVDSSASKLIADDNGEVLDDQTNQATRYRYRAEVVRDGARWWVERTTPSLAEPC
jgi:hypothetical protein